MRPATGARPGPTERPWRFLVIWCLAWAGVGIAVGVTAQVVSAFQDGRSVPLGEVLSNPIAQISLLCAEIVGLTALSISRWIFPYYSTLAAIPRVLLQSATLVGGSLFGTILALAAYPLFTAHKFRMVLVIGAVNSVLAVVVGIAVHTYETMRRQIEKGYVELRKKEAMDREVEFAREVQEQLFPKSVPHVRGLELAGICLPAAGVGGDYYDYLPLDDERVGLVVADVSGKGISAALLMASLQASVRNVVRPGANPAEINRHLNQVLYRSTTASRYATFFFGLFDSETRTLRYSNAGHNPPMVLGRAGPRKLSEGGLPLGILDAVTYTEGEMTLEPGDLLLLYTDGAVEAADPAGTEFGLDRLMGTVAPLRDRPELTEMVHAAVDRLRDWTRDSPQQDDITLVIGRAVS